MEGKSPKSPDKQIKDIRYSRVFSDVFGIVRREGSKLRESLSRYASRLKKYTRWYARN